MILGQRSSIFLGKVGTYMYSLGRCSHLHVVMKNIVLGTGKRGMHMGCALTTTKESTRGGRMRKYNCCDHSLSIDNPFH